MPMIADVMARAGLEFADLDRIAVTHGPGTFTGTRIGIAAARALHLATGAALVSASSLAVMAQQASRALVDQRAILVAVDARREQIYAQLFKADGSAVGVPQVSTIGEAASLGGMGPVLVAGSGASAVAADARACGRDAIATLPDLQPDAVDLAALASGLEPVTQPLRPLYLRPPDAKPQDGKSLPWSTS